MKAGSLNRRVTIQKKTAGEDAYGQPLEAWEDVATVAAAIEDIRGNQFFAAQATQNLVHTKITIRYLPGIAPSMRVMHGADVFDIHAVLGQDRVKLELMCGRGVSDG